METNNVCIVKNRSASKIVYTIPEIGIRREFMPGESKRLSYDELEKLTFQPGGLTILARFLQVQNNEVTKDFGIHTEPEYFMNETDIINLIQKGSLDSFLDALDFAPTGVIDLIKKFSVSLPLTDFQKRKALKEKTGLDIDKVIQHLEEEKEDEITPSEAPERRVKISETTSGRRTAGTNYKVSHREESAANV